jgi:uncharacterized protein (TIGR02268 family)
MLPTVLPSLLALAVLRAVPVVVPTATACQDVLRVELSRTLGASQEICVSPGLLTGFVFDTSVVVDLEAESRFGEVIRGRTSISLMPPADGVAGERLRLTARFPDGTSITFVLVVHSGQATRQVEVYQDQRTRESYQHELAQARARNQQLQQALEQLRAECGEPGSLWRFLVSGAMPRKGIPSEMLPLERVEDSKKSLFSVGGHTYRTTDRVAVDVHLFNFSTEPWTVVEASLVDAKGNELRRLLLWQEGGAIPPEQQGRLVLEFEMNRNASRENFTLMLRENGPRAMTFRKVTLPP